MRNKIVRCFCALLLGCIVLNSQTVYASEPSGLQDGAVYVFMCGESEMSLGASCFGISDLSSVTQLETYDGSLNQAWRVHAAEDGAWYMECLSNGKYLTLYRSTKKENGVAYLSEMKESAAQRWHVSFENGYVRLTSVHSGLALQPLNGELTEKNKVRQFAIADEQSQLWRYEMVDDGSTIFPQMLSVTGDIVKISCPEITKFKGVYYLFGDNRDGCGIRRSTDLLTWEAIDNAYTYQSGYPASWIPKDVPNCAMWCPGIYQIGDTYYVYYAITTLYSQRSTIGIFTNTTLDPEAPDYLWVDAGPVISSYNGDPYNCIDPCVIHDENNDPWLLFGSSWSGLKVVRLDRETGKLLNPDHPEIIGIANRVKGDRAIEGGYMIEKDGNYYLFAAVGIMTQGTYSNGVGRAASVTGPFYARDGVPMTEGGYKGGATLITEEKEEIIMPGHCSIFQDEDGQWYFVLEYFPKGVDAKLGISTIVWDDEGWPWTALTPEVLSLGTGDVTK